MLNKIVSSFVPSLDPSFIVSGLVGGGKLDGAANGVTNAVGQTLGQKPSGGGNFFEGFRDLLQGKKPEDTSTTDKVLELVSKLIDLIQALVSGEKAPQAAKNGVTNDGIKRSNGCGAANNATPGGGSAGGLSQEFLWKPKSDKDGKLVVLLPSDLSGQVTSVKILGSNNVVIEQGRDAGFGNGGRHHFRFDKAGGGYPAGVRVVAELAGGGTFETKISQTAVRTEKMI